MKRTLSIVCHPNEFSGHGIHSCNVIRRLPALLDMDIVVRPTARGQFPADIAKLIRPGENDAEWEIILGPPNIQPTAGKRTIYMTTCESTRLKPESVQMLNAAELVITPSQFCATVFSASGVDRPIHVVPLGFGKEFMYQVMPNLPFTFACAGQLSNGPNRKGIQRIIDLFLKAFPTEDVRLNVKVQETDWIFARNDNRITVPRVVLNEQEVAHWLSRCHCFINLATEGFGLWPLQAMAVGRPVISPVFGGVTEYLRDSITVSHKLVPAKDSWIGLWAEADDDSVIAAMRYTALSQNLDFIATRGYKAHCNTRHLTWENSINSLATVLRQSTQCPETVTSSRRETDEDAILNFYSRHTNLTKRRVDDRFHRYNLTNTPKGFGDALILSPIPESAQQCQKGNTIVAPFHDFAALSEFIPGYKVAHETAPRIAADVLQREWACGNGHFIQRLHRAIGLPVPLRPVPRLDVMGDKIPGRVALHFTAGVHAIWQRKHIHPLARQIYPETQNGLQQFIDTHHNYEFVEVGSQPSSAVKGVRNETGLTIGDTLRVLKTCEFFVGIMSGPMHAATALGCKCIVLINFPDPRDVFLPTLKDVDVVESEWMYPQNVHLHQEGEGQQVKRFSSYNLERAFAGDIYPYWSDRFLHLIL